MSDRSEKWHATRRARELALFSGQQFEVVREVKGEPFKTPLGYSGKNGYEVRNIESGETFKVGKDTLKRMASEYEAVTLPAPKKRGRPKKVVFATGGLISHGPRDPQDDTIPAFLSAGCVFGADRAKELYGSEFIEGLNVMSAEDARKETEFVENFETDSPYQPAKDSETSEPGAHPVSEPNDENDRSGSLAGPTYQNPNSDEHLEA